MNRRLTANPIFESPWRPHHIFRNRMRISCCNGHATARTSSRSGRAIGLEANCRLQQIHFCGLLQRRLNSDSLDPPQATHAANCFYWIHTIVQIMADDSVVALSKSSDLAWVMMLSLDLKAIVRYDCFYVLDVDLWPYNQHSFLKRSGCTRTPSELFPNTYQYVEKRRFEMLVPAWCSACLSRPGRHPNGPPYRLYCSDFLALV